MITHCLATTGHDSGYSHLHQICCCFISSRHTSRHISWTHKLQPPQGLLRAPPAPPKQGGALHPTPTHKLFHKHHRFYGRFRHEIDMHREKKNPFLADLQLFFWFLACNRKIFFSHCNLRTQDPKHLCLHL